MLCALLIGASVAGRVTIVHEINSKDVMAGPKLAALKATWKKAFDIKGVAGVVTARYDQKHSEKYVKDVMVSGTIPTGDSIPVALSYDVMHNLQDKQTAYKLTTAGYGVEVVAATPFEEGGEASLCCGAPSVTEVSAGRDLDLGGQKANVFTTYNLKSKAARLALELKSVGPGDLSADVAYDVGSEARVPEVEVSYSGNLAPRRNIKATLTANGGVVEYMDTALERQNGAVWIARATAPYSGEVPKLTVRRHWSLAI